MYILISFRKSLSNMQTYIPSFDLKTLSPRSSCSTTRHHSLRLTSISPRLAYAAVIVFQATTSLSRVSSNNWRATTKSPLVAWPAIGAVRATTSLFGGSVEENHGDRQIPTAGVQVVESVP